jgi:hypothetical protein
MGKEITLLSIIQLQKRMKLCHLQENRQSMALREKSQA